MNFRGATAIRLAAIGVCLSGVCLQSIGAAPAPANTNPIATIVTSLGTIRCELFRNKAPMTVQNFIDLARGTKEWTDPTTQKKLHRPYFNGLIFHRVIPGFMVQSGDPMGTGFGGPGYNITDEFNNGLHFDVAGRLAMANTGRPNTGGSQFFITTNPRPELNGGYTIFGQVISGQSVVHEISIVARDETDRPLRPVQIESVMIEAPR